MLKFSPAETAIATRTDIKTVHNVIDDLLPEAAGPTRSLSATDIVIVAAFAALSPYLTSEAKRVFVTTYKKAPRSRVVRFRYSTGLNLELHEIRSTMLQGMRTVRELRHLATADPKVMNGEPTFRGTRIPIALIAHMVESGDSVERIREGYPALTERQVQLAPLWVKTYPRRGRPPERPWEQPGSGRSKRVTRMRLIPTP